MVGPATLAPACTRPVAPVPTHQIQQYVQYGTDLAGGSRHPRCTHIRARRRRDQPSVPFPARSRGAQVLDFEMQAVTVCVAPALSAPWVATSSTLPTAWAAVAETVA
jgi:hypothetical protein